MSLVVCRCVHLMKLVPKYVFIQLNMRYKFINPALSRMECGSSDFFVVLAVSRDHEHQ